MNLLITSVGRRTYMVDSFKKSLGPDGKVFTANTKETYALKQGDGWTVSPLIYDETYIDFLLEYCKKNKIEAIISLFDIDLPVLSGNKRRFEENGIKLLISDYDFVSISNDKWRFYHYLIKQDFDAPKTFLSLTAALSAIDQKQVQFPLIVKPRWGIGSLGIFKADNPTELEAFFEKTKNRIWRSYLKYESSADVENCVIIQEILKGEEWGLDIFNDLSGNYLSAVPKRKLEMRSGETDIAQIVKDEKLIDFAKKISSMSKHIGNMDVDFFRDGDKLSILEFNPRFGGQYPFSHIAGVNFPEALVQLLKGKTPDSRNFEFNEITASKDMVIRVI